MTEWLCYPLLAFLSIFATVGFGYLLLCLEMWWDRWQERRWRRRQIHQWALNREKQ